MKLSHSTPVAVSIAYATSDGTATAGSDYNAANGKVTIAPGQTSATITVQVIGDTAVEQDETFAVTLSSPANAKLGKAAATGTIKNDDVVKTRPGAYAGTTSQGKALTFNVSADGTGVSDISTTIDVNCTEVQGFTLTVPLTSTAGAVFPINPDLTFDANQHQVASDGTTLDIAFHGALTATAGGSGTLQVDLMVPNVPGVGDVHCSTGPVTWTAS